MRKTLLLLNRGKKATIAKYKYYHRMIDFIIFFIIEIRPNITYAISVASHFAKNSSYQHSKVIKIFFHYLKTAKKVKIIKKRE